MWPRIVIGQFEVFIFEAEDVLYVRVQSHFRERARLTGQLQVYLFQVVQVDVRVA